MMFAIPSFSPIPSFYFPPRLQDGWAETLRKAGFRVEIDPEPRKEGHVLMTGATATFGEIETFFSFSLDSRTNDTRILFGSKNLMIGGWIERILLASGMRMSAGAKSMPLYLLFDCPEGVLREWNNEFQSGGFAVDLHRPHDEKKSVAPDSLGVATKDRVSLAVFGGEALSENGKPQFYVAIEVLSKSLFRRSAQQRVLSDAVALLSRNGAIRIDPRVTASYLQREAET